MEDSLIISKFRMLLNRGKGKFPPLFGVFMRWEDNGVNADLILHRLSSQVLYVKLNCI